MEQMSLLSFNLKFIWVLMKDISSRLEGIDMLFKDSILH